MICWAQRIQLANAALMRIRWAGLVRSPLPIPLDVTASRPARFALRRRLAVGSCASVDSHPFVIVQELSSLLKQKIEIPDTTSHDCSAWADLRLGLAALDRRDQLRSAPDSRTGSNEPS